MAVSKWNWNNANPSTMEEGRDDYKDYHWVPDGEYSSHKVFPPLYFHATQAQVQAAYAALTGHTKTTNFNQRVWNDLVDKIVELQQDFGIAPSEWLSRDRCNEVQNPISAYICSEEPGYVGREFESDMTKHKNLGHALYAFKFNLLVDALVTLPATWTWPWEDDGVEIAPGTPVKGSYILALVRAINYWCDQPQAQFVATIAVSNLLTMAASARCGDALHTAASIPMPLTIEGVFEQINPSDLSVDPDWLNVHNMTAGEFRLPDACDIEMYQYIVEDADVEIWMGEFEYAPPGPIKATNITTGTLTITSTVVSNTATHISSSISESTSVIISGMETISSSSMPKATISGSLGMDDVGLECIEAGSVFTEPITMDFHQTMDNISVASLDGNVLDTIDLRFELQYNNIELSSANRIELQKTYADFSIAGEVDLEVLTYYVELGVSASFTVQTEPNIQVLPEAAMEVYTYLTTDEDVMFTPLPTDELNAVGVMRTEFSVDVKSNYSVHPEIDTSLTTWFSADFGDHQYAELTVSTSLTFKETMEMILRQASPLVAEADVDVFTSVNSNGDDLGAHAEAETIINTDNLATARIGRGAPAEAAEAYIMTFLATCIRNRFMPIEAVAPIVEQVRAELDEMNLETLEALASFVSYGTGELEYTVGTLLNTFTKMNFVVEVDVPTRRRAFYLNPPADTTGTFYTADGDIFLDANGDNIVTSANIFEVTTFNMEFKGDMFITSDGMQFFTSDDKEFTPL